MRLVSCDRLAPWSRHWSEVSSIMTGFRGLDRLRRVTKAVTIAGWDLEWDGGLCYLCSAIRMKAEFIYFIV